MNKLLITILVIIIAGISTCYWDSCREWNKKETTYILNDTLLQRSIREFRDSSNRELHEYSIQTITTNQLLTSRANEADQLRRDLEKVHAKLADVRTSTSVASTTRDTVSIPIDRIIKIRDTGNVDIPFSHRPDSFLSVSGISHLHIADSSLLFRSIQLDYTIRNNSSITYYNESKFLHKDQLRLLITQDNPHTTTGKVQTYYITPDKKLYQKWWFHAAIGSAATIVALHYLR